MYEKVFKNNLTIQGSDKYIYTYFSFFNMNKSTRYMLVEPGITFRTSYVTTEHLKE